MVVGVIGLGCDCLGRWWKLGGIKCIRFYQRFNQIEVDYFCEKKRKERRGMEGAGVQVYSVSSKTLTIMECLSRKKERKRKGKDHPSYGSIEWKNILVFAKDFC